MTWVTSTRYPERGVHEIADCDFDPRRHTRKPAPAGAVSTIAPQGDGRPQVSKQEAAEEAKKTAEAAAEVAAMVDEKPAKGKKAKSE